MDTPADFWTWFAARAEALLRVDDPADPLLAQMAAALERVDPELRFEIGPYSRARGGRELAFGVGGNRAKFPLVQALVQAAPDIAGWAPVAFFPRKDLDLGLSSGAHTLFLEDLTGTAKLVEGGIDLTLYLDEFSPETEALARALVPALLGEYDAAVRVARLAMKAMPEEPPEGLASAEDLRDLVDSLQSDVNPP